MTRRARDLRFVAASAAALAILTSVPYVAAHALDDRDSRFLDTLVFEQDFNSYCAFVRQSAEGAWLFDNPFTPEPHRASFLNLEFLVTGRLAGLLRLEAGRALQIQRVAAGTLLAFGLWGLGAQLIAAPTLRRVFFIAALTGGGFGWMRVLPGLGRAVERMRPVDLYAGVHPFFWLFLHPHFVAGEAMVVLALGALLAGERTGRGAFHLAAGTLAALVGLVRPYDMLFLQVTAVLYAAAVALQERRAEKAPAARRLLPAVMPLPVLAYSLWLFRFDPVFRWWGRQGVNGPPPARSMLAGLGLLPVLLAAALVASRRRPWTRGETLMACAVATSLLLVYSYPWLSFSFQFVTTLVVPALLLALSRLEVDLLPLGATRRGAVLAALVLAMNALSSAALWAIKLAEAQGAEFRIAGSERAALAWLRAHSRARDVVLAGRRTSNRVPRYTDDAVVAGYEFSTVRFAEKLERVQRFFRASTADAFRERLLAQLGVRYVVHGSEERQLGGYDPARSAFLGEAFRDGDMAVYEVRLGSDALVGEDDHAGVEGQRAGDEEAAAAVSRGKRARPADQAVVAPQAHGDRPRLLGGEEPVGYRIGDHVPVAGSLGPGIPLDHSGLRGPEHLREVGVQPAVEGGLAQIAVPPSVPEPPCVGGLDGMEGRDAGHGAATRRVLQPVDQGQLRAERRRHGTHDTGAQQRSHAQQAERDRVQPLGDR